MKCLFHNFVLFQFNLFFLFEFAINYLDLLDFRVADWFLLNLQLIICISTDVRPLFLENHTFKSHISMKRGT